MITKKVRQMTTILVFALTTGACTQPVVVQPLVRIPPCVVPQAQLVTYRDLLTLYVQTLGELKACSYKVDTFNRYYGKK